MALVRIGHSGVWDYPWTLFMAAVSDASKGR